MSKGYTINYFLDVFKNTTNKELASNGVFQTVAPRNGFNSVKATTLNKFLDYQTIAIARGNGAYAVLGATPRARLMKALANRKRTGSTLA